MATSAVPATTRCSRTLRAVSAAANREKGASGPGDWLPPRAEYHCRYVRAWLAVKARWGLAMDRDERRALDRALAGCQDR
jgi:hypothetical protein